MEYKDIIDCEEPNGHVKYKVLTFLALQQERDRIELCKFLAEVTK